MRSITSKAIGISAATMALMGAAAVPAFAANPSQSGTITGTVTVAESLTLNLANNTFTVNGATPGQSYNGIPAASATVYTNDSAGYLLTAYMNDGSTPAAYPGCAYPAAFETSGDSAAIPDEAWTIASTGGPGATGQQTFPAAPKGTPDGLNDHLCIPPGSLTNPVTLGQAGGMSGASGDQFTEQLAVTVPANTPANGTYTGGLSVLAVAN